MPHGCRININSTEMGPTRRTLVERCHNNVGGVSH